MTTLVTSQDIPTIQLTEPTEERNQPIQSTQNESHLKNKQNVQQISNYVIYKKTLGSGSMGTVKLAECLSDKDHQLYAVKIMPKLNLNAAVDSTDKKKDPKDTPKEREQRTVREMAIMHLLRHPNICQLKEWVVQDEKYYMFLEYVKGGQLLDYIMSHGKLKEKLARKFARQIVSALDYCHRNSIVHRDLKIENILITDKEEIKIIDFGLSNIYSPVSVLNTFCGSLYFAAPELLQAKHYTGPEVDVWSFGVVLYVLVCGRVPFDDTSLPALHKKIKTGHVVYPDHLSKECVDLLSKILVADPTKRETLSFAIYHPWMNKGYDEPVFNHLPHRQPLTDIDDTVIQGMEGFGLGPPEEIESKLLTIISSPEYQSAATQVDQNYQPPKNDPASSNQDTSMTTKWRRNLSIRRTVKTSIIKKDKDDPQSLPAMYDPLISIYYLVKERKEFDEKINLLESEGYQSPVKLGRSASTSLSKPSKIPQQSQTTALSRRKTERVPPSYNRPTITPPEEDLSAPIKRTNSTQPQTSLLQRSKSAAKRLGGILPANKQTDEIGDNEQTERRLSSTGILQQPQQQSNDLKRSPSLKQKTMNLFRSTSLNDKKYRQQRKKSHPSIDDDSTKRSSPSSSTSTREGDKYVDEGSNKQEYVQKVNSQPKSIFDFNRRHLFKVTSDDMMKYIQQILLKIGVRYASLEPFKLNCELYDWAQFQQHTPQVDEGVDYQAKETVNFALLVYQARWAGGRLGIKILEAEEEKDNVYRQIYHTILNELSHFIH